MPSIGCEPRSSARVFGGSDRPRRVARAGDRLDDAFAFLEKLGYAEFELAPGGELVPVAARRDGDFWFISREDCAA